MPILTSRLPLASERSLLTSTSALQLRLRVNATWLAAGVVAALPLILSWPLLGEPMLKDEGVYFTVAMFDGLPYVSAFDHKPPLVYAWYHLALLANGGEASTWTIHLIAACQLSATALGVMWIGHQIGGRRLGVTAGMLMACLVANQHLQFNANTEVFTLAPATFALGAWVAGVRTGRVAWFALAGILLAAAVLTKTVAATQLVALTLLLFWRDGDAQASKLPAMRSAAVLIAAFAGSTLAALTPWIVTGHFGEFWHANVTYNVLYGAETSPTSQFWAVFDVEPRVVGGGLIVWTLAAGGVGLLFSRGVTAPWAAVIACAGSAYAGASATGREYAHYWALLAPFAALLAAHGLGVLMDGWQSARKRLHAEALLLALAVPTIIAVLPLYLVDVDEAHTLKNPDKAEARAEVASTKVAAYVASLSAPDDEILVFGLEAQLYALAGRRPAAYYNRPLAALRVEPESFERTMREIEADPPAVIVDSARTEIPAQRGSDTTTSAIVIDIDPARRERFDAFLAAHYEFKGRVEYADVYALR
jgi:4-amino-4-deoxy-L-arabinose transferase-like glycosyltransferase